MGDVIYFLEVPFLEMLRVLSQGAGFTADLIRANRTFSVCLLTVSFSLFLLIFSLVYINPNLYVASCELNNSDSNVPEIQYNEPSTNLALERYVGVVSVNKYTTDSDFNFLPDINDIEINDETNELLESDILENEESEKPPDVVDREALTALKMALRCKQQTNFDKAQKLFNHAIALNPNHHDVLLHYGEFLESRNDVINADHFYLKAIMLKPKNSRALANRRRVLPVVKEMDREELRRIDAKRAALGKLNKKKSNLKRLKKEIYFQHIHHTVAIEGNTMSLAETRSVVETRMAISGKSILEHNVILGLEKALRYVNQTLVNKNGGISIVDILEIHKRVMGHADPKFAGCFRKSQVFVGEHTPPAASDVEVLMDEFVASLRSPLVQNMHPIYIAAFAHHKLVFIHPFLDGNGRTARLLMNLLFIRYGYPPIIIRKEQRSQYYKFLQIANEGDSRPFYRFIARATEYTLDVFLHLDFENSRLMALESVHDIKDVIPLGSSHLDA